MSPRPRPRAAFRRTFTRKKPLRPTLPPTTWFSLSAYWTRPAARTGIVFPPNSISTSTTAARSADFISYDETTFRAFDEEKLTNFEVGLKGGALDNRLQLTAAVYTMKWEGRLQQTVFNWIGVDPDPVTGLCTDPLCWNDGTRDPQGRIFNTQQTRSGNIPIPSGDSDLYGVELGGSYAPDDNWNFRGSFALSNAEYSPLCDPNPVNHFRIPPDRGPRGR